MPRCSETRSSASEGKLRRRSRVWPASWPRPLPPLKGEVPRRGGGVNTAWPWPRGPEFFWQSPASWSKRIFFLARARKKTLSKRKKTPKKTLRKGFLWTLSQTEGPRPLRHPWSSRIEVQEKVESAYENREHSLSVLQLRSMLAHLQRSYCRAADFRSCSGEEQISSGNFSSLGAAVV